jgi:hypothetical protein
VQRNGNAGQMGEVCLLTQEEGQIVHLALRVLRDMALAKSDYESEAKVRQIITKLAAWGT